MSMRYWIRRLFYAPVRTIRKTQRVRLALERLEDRYCPSTFTVTNALDDGSTGSLRWAVAQANSNPGADTLNFGTFFTTAKAITLSGSQLELTDTTGKTTITGPLAGVTISGNAMSRVFQVDADVSASISGLTITDGSVTGNGAGLNNLGTTTLTDCTITGNHAISASNTLSGLGGGVANYTGTLTLTNCTISGNTADVGGGGVANAGIPAGAPSSKYPFGAPAVTSELTMTGCHLTGNSAGNGAGLYNTTYGITTLTDCTITGNHAISASNTLSGLAGGVGNKAGTLTLTNCTLSGNTADVGGGGAANAGLAAAAPSTRYPFGAPALTGELTMTGCTISGNSAGKGAGLYTAALSDTTLTDCTVTGNHSVGGFDSTSNTLSGVGGGAANNAGTLTLTNCNISGNTADFGGGGLANAGIPANPAPGGGKGSASGTGEMTMTDCSVSGNSAGAASGVFNGVPFVAQPSGGAKGSATVTTVPATLAMDQCTVTGNVALPGGGSAGSTYGGAGFGVSNLGSASLINCTVSGNEGGGVFSDGQVFDNVVFGAGKVTPTTGISGSLQMNNCTVSANSASSSGSSPASLGFGVVANDATLTNCTVNGNAGGGVFNDAPSSTVAVSLVMINCTVTGHSAPASGGKSYSGFGVVNSSNTTLTNCTISGNDGGVYDLSGGTALLNTIVGGNASADLHGSAFSGSNNLIGTDASNELVNGNNGNIVGISAAGLQLGSLANNGGPTQTMSLLAGSPALSSGASVVFNSLSAAIADTVTTTITLFSTSGLGVGLYVRIDSEIMLITGVTGATTLSVARGQLSTSAATHGADANVILATDQRSYARRLTAPDIGAFEAGSVTLSIIAGDHQTTSLDTAFSTPLEIQVISDQGIAMAGWTVTFTAPSSGVSAILSTATPVTTDSNGFAQVTAIANAMSGSYVVTGSAVGASSAVSFHLTNDGLVVNTTQDELTDADGLLSLREAIIIANSLGGNQTITFDSTVFATPQTITLQTGAGFGVLSITDTTGTVTIQGPTACVSVDGNHATQVFSIISGASAEIDGLTIENGSATNGGGINNAGSLYLSGSTLSGNSASNNGGGISNTGAATVSGAMLSGNSANNGGGIYNNGVLNVSSGTISGNSAVSGGGGISNTGTATVGGATLSGNSANNGGGLFNSGTTTLTGSTLFANSAGHDAGGIFNTGTATITGANIVSGNSALYGGGIFNMGTATIMGGTVSSNHATKGGGMFNYRTATISGTTFSSNSGSLGAGLFNSNTVTLSGATLSSNSASVYGGGFFNYGSATVTGTSFSANRAAASGGGFFNSGSAAVSGGTLSANSATRGGAIFNFGRATISGVSVSSNSATHGAGVFNTGTATISGGTISSNSASGDGGGFFNYGTATLVATTLTGNTAVIDGGGIFNSRVLTVSGGTLSRNVARFDGGGIANYGTATVSGATLSANSAKYDGGGLFNAHGATASLTGGAITSNSAGLAGGGFMNYGGGTISGTNVSGNTAKVFPDHN
jgi:hypothetical protein